MSAWRDADTAGVRVSDAGPGVPADARQHIFERFARQDAARSRTGGAGLGLSICMEIVSAHGGRIWVEDNEPRGSTFVVALPLMPGPGAGDSPPPRLELTAPGAPSRPPPG